MYQIQMNITEQYINDIINFCKEIVQMTDSLPLHSSTPSPLLSPEQIMEVISSYPFTTSFEEELQALKSDKKIQKIITDLTVCRLHQ